MSLLRRMLGILGFTSIRSKGRKKSANQRRREFVRPLRLQTLEDRAMLTSMVSVNGPGTTVSEGGGAIFYLTVSPPSPTPVTIGYETVGGTATQGTDYQGTSGSATVYPGQPYAVVSVPTFNDSVLESAETFSLTITSASGGAGIGTATRTMTINDVPPGLVSVTPPNNHVGEGNQAIFYLTISTPQSQPVTVNYRTVPGSAIENTDYLGATGTATISPYQGYAVVSINTYHDFATEPAETFALEVTSVSGAALDQSHSSATMNIDDGTHSAPPTGGQNVTWSISASAATEPNDGVDNLPVTISLSSSLSSPLTFTYATSDSTATVDLDYDAASGTIVFAPGETQKTINVEIRSDWITEPSESFVFSATPSGSTPPNVYLVPSASQSLECIIHDNGNWLGEPFSVADGSEWESDEEHVNPGHLPFVVELDEIAGRDIEFSYSLATEEAGIGQDFDASGGTLTIPAGQLQGTIWIDLLDESIPEGDETFVVYVSEIGTPLPTIPAVGTIFDDDLGSLETATGTVMIMGAPLVQEPLSSNTSEGTYAHFLVTYSNPSGQTATVEWYTDSPNSGDATAGSDYVAASGTLTLSPMVGASQAVDVAVQIKFDTSYPEPDEPFSVKLRNPSGITISAGGDEARGTIKDRGDSTLLATEYTIYAVIPEADEVGNRPAGFTLMRTGPIDQPDTVLFDKSGTADYGYDYYLANMNGEEFAGGLTDRVTIPAGSSAVSFLAVPKTDAVTPEPDETVILTIAVGQPRGNPESATAVIHDAGNRVSITVSRPTTDEDTSGERTFTVSRWGSTTNELTVNLSRSGDASLGYDYFYVYMPPPGQRAPTPDRGYFPSFVRIPAGSAIASITVQIIDDPIVEDPDETLTVSIVSGTGYTADPQADSATLTIVDDDVTPTVAITPPTASVNEWGNASTDLTLSRTGSTEFALPVDLGIAGAATKEIDYRLFKVENGNETPVSGRNVSFDPGSSTITLRLKPIDDDSLEPIGTSTENGEDAEISIVASERLIPSTSQTTATVRIVDNEHPNNSQWDILRSPPAMPPVYTDWVLKTARGGTHYYERTKLIGEWKAVGGANVVPPAPIARDVTVSLSVSITNAKTYTISGSFSGGVEFFDWLNIGGSIQGGLENQIAISWSSQVSETISVPINAVLEITPAALRIDSVIQYASAASENSPPPPSGAAGDSQVTREENGRFWYTWLYQQFSTEFVFVSGSYWVKCSKP